MSAADRIWTVDDADDAALAGAIAAQLDLASLPAECTAGVALNARLLQRHLDTLREAS
jgi:hypothetical protein